MSENFTSITTWQGDYGWAIDVMIEGFATIDEAAAFGAFARRLIREENQLILIDKDGERILLSDAGVCCFELLPESVGKTMISQEDFVERDIPIYLFSEIKGLNGTFGSLSYGVQGNNGAFVSFDASIYLKKEKTFPSNACPPHDELVFIAPDPYLFAQYWRDRDNFTQDNFCFWTDGETIAVRKNNGEQIEQILNQFKGTIVTKSERDM